MIKPYVHGYDPRESIRLQDQATTLVDLLHSDTAYPAGSSVLESFDHVFVCFVLEHIKEPIAALRKLKACFAAGRHLLLHLLQSHGQGLKKRGACWVAKRLFSWSVKQLEL